MNNILKFIIAIVITIGFSQSLKAQYEVKYDPAGWTINGVYYSKLDAIILATVEKKFENCLSISRKNIANRMYYCKQCTQNDIGQERAKREAELRRQFPDSYIEMKVAVETQYIGYVRYSCKPESCNDREITLYTIGVGSSPGAAYNNGKKNTTLNSSTACISGHGLDNYHHVSFVSKSDNKKMIEESIVKADNLISQKKYVEAKDVLTNALYKAKDNPALLSKLNQVNNLIEKEKEKEKQAKEKLESERLEKEKLEKDRVERERLQKEQATKNTEKQNSSSSSNGTKNTVSSSSTSNSTSGNGSYNSSSSGEMAVSDNGGYYDYEAKRKADALKAKREADERGLKTYYNFLEFQKKVEAESKKGWEEVRRKMDENNEAWRRGQSFRDAWDKASSLNINTNDPSKILAEYRSKIAEINRLYKQQQNEMLRKIQDINNSAKGTSATNQFATGIMTFVAGAAAAADAAAEKRRIQDNLAAQKERAFNKIKTDIISTNNTNSTRFHQAAASALRQDMVNYYRAMAEYFDCYTRSVNSNFSASSDRWIENNCKQPSDKPRNSDAQTSVSEMLSLAKNKISESKTSAHSSQLLSSANSLLETVLSKESRNAEAYYLKSTITSDDIDAYMSAYAAYSLSNKIEPYASNFKLIQNRFNQNFYSALLAENLTYLEKSANADLDKAAFLDNEPSPIVYTVANNKPKSLDILLENDEDFTKRKSNLRDLLAYAIFKNSKDVALYLVNRLTNNSPKDFSFNESLVLFAARSNSFETGLALLKAGVAVPNLSRCTKEEDRNTINNLSEVYAFYAFEKDDSTYLNNSFFLNRKFYQSDRIKQADHIVKAITERKTKYLQKLCNYNIKKDYFGAGVLLANDPTTFQILAKKGFDVDAKDQNGETALHRAIINDNVFLVELLSKLCNVNVKNNEGYTPLHLSCHKNKSYYTQLLLQNKSIDVNAKGPYGWTPLHFAARENDKHTVSILLQNGARKDNKDVWKRRPYSVAREHQYKSLKAELK